MLEAGMFPGVITTLSYWYRTDEVGRPILWFFSIAQFSSIIGSLVAYGTSFMNGLQGLSGWRWAFIIEGVATVLLAIVIYFILPDFPKSKRSNSWLTPREQQFIEARLHLMLRLLVIQAGTPRTPSLRSRVQRLGVSCSIKL